MSLESFMYTDMTERNLLRWGLDYTMPQVIKTFQSIPDEHLAVRPRRNINAPGWIFGHIAVTERVHVGNVLEGVNDVPPAFWVFRAGDPTEANIRQAIESKQSLIDYWQAVRAKTYAYLDRISDADLKEIPRHSPTFNPDECQNPIREWFIMTIKHQNEHWGQLEIITKLLVADRAGG